VKSRPRIPKALIWLAALGITGGSVYYLNRRSGLPLAPGRLLELAGIVTTFSKDDAAESYLKSICPVNSSRQKLVTHLGLSNMTSISDPEVSTLAGQHYQANSDALSQLTSNIKRWPDGVKPQMSALIEEIKDENNLLYKYLHYAGSVQQLTNGDLSEGLRRIQYSSNPSPRVLIRMRLEILNVHC
jgi:hypothetical protein